MDAPELDQDAQALLAGLGLGGGGDDHQDPQPDPNDPVVWAPPAADKSGGDQQAVQQPVQHPDPNQYVPKAAYDDLARQMRDMQEQMGRIAAQTLQQNQQRPASEPAPYQPMQGGVGAPNAADARQQLNERFFTDPIGTLTQILPILQQQQTQPLLQSQQQTQVAIGRQQLAMLRDQMAREFPAEVVQRVLPKVDQIVQATTPEQLARMVIDGSLGAEYRKAFTSAAGETLLTVYARGAERQRQSQQQPPAAMSGGANGADRVIDFGQRRAANQPIRMSELSEADRIAVEEGRKLGLTPEQVLSQEVN